MLINKLNKYFLINSVKETIVKSLNINTFEENKKYYVLNECVDSLIESILISKDLISDSILDADYIIYKKSLISNGYVDFANEEDEDGILYAEIYKELYDSLDKYPHLAKKQFIDSEVLIPFLLDGYAEEDLDSNIDMLIDFHNNNLDYSLSILAYKTKFDFKDKEDFYLFLDKIYTDSFKGKFNFFIKKLYENSNFKNSIQHIISSANQHDFEIEMKAYIKFREKRINDAIKETLKTLEEQEKQNKEEEKTSSSKFKNLINKVFKKGS